MSAPIQLVPLVCYNCQTPIPAEADEVAWVCPNCGKGLFLNEDCGAEPLDIHFAAGVQPGRVGRPFWVTPGSVALGRREVYGGGNQSQDAARFWQGARTFFIPAYACTLDELIETGIRLIQQPPALQDGSPAPFQPVVTHRDDLKPYAEFIVMGIEAGRKDKLRTLEMALTLETPRLWILP